MSANRESLFSFAYRSLVSPVSDAVRDGDLPWAAVQAFWKLLTLAGAVVLVYATTTLPERTPVAVQVLLYAFAAAWFLAFLLTKLDE